MAQRQVVEAEAARDSEAAEHQRQILELEATKQDLNAAKNQVARMDTELGNATRERSALADKVKELLAKETRPQLQLLTQHSARTIQNH